VARQIGQVAVHNSEAGTGLELEVDIQAVGEDIRAGRTAEAGLRNHVVAEALRRAGAAVEDSLDTGSALEAVVQKVVAVVDRENGQLEVDTDLAEDIAGRVAVGRLYTKSAQKSWKDLQQYVVLTALTVRWISRHVGSLLPVWIDGFERQKRPYTDKIKGEQTQRKLGLRCYSMLYEVLGASGGVVREGWGSAHCGGAGTSLVRRRERIGNTPSHDCSCLGERGWCPHD
jgi:hypothetical protein